MNDNRVVIYSNGIADFQRAYEVEAGAEKRISIPVRQDHLADVLASFNVYGDVTLQTPPTFRPSNENEGNLEINASNVLEDAATTLSGARVRIKRASGDVEGTLVGLQEEDEATQGEPIHPKSIIVLTDDGLQRCLMREIQSFQFLDEDVRTEIDKALRRSYQRIKPNSTFVELGLTAESNADAIVQYSIPAAAWKISYRLRMSENHPTELQGFAIVDNNTDEDWTDFKVCVVTGEPITFSTDLAESKSPSRSHVDLVSEEALGAVEVEEAVSAALHIGGAGPSRSKRKATDMMNQSILAHDMTAGSMRHSANVASAEVHEVGDFNIFESATSVTIPAKRSTVIPVFNVEVSEVKSVLHYKHENHATRPYRSIDFTNETEFSLGRGVCTVYEESTYSGNCVVPALKPTESRLLPHALETGVSVRREEKRQRNKVVSLRLADGFCYTSTRQRQATHYHVKSSRDQPFEFVLDHTCRLRESDVDIRFKTNDQEETLEPTENLKDGHRLKLKLEPRAEFVVMIDEQRIEQSAMELANVTKPHENLSVDWLTNNIVATNGPLATDEGVRTCLKIHDDLEAKRREMTDLKQEIERLTTRQERLRENIKAGGQDELTSRWRAELDEAERAIRSIEEERTPAIREEERAIESQLKTALKSLSAEWSAE